MNRDSPEWSALMAELNSGRLEPYKPWLDAFVTRNCPEIWKMYQKLQAADPGTTLAGAIEAYIKIDAKGVVCPAEEGRAQWQELEKEFWYFGERAHREPTRKEKEGIIMSWANQHAKGWRDWRIMEYNFLVESDPSHYEWIVQQTVQPSRAA